MHTENAPVAPAPQRSRWGTRLDVGIGVVLLGLVVVGALRWLDVTLYPVVVLQTAAPFVVIGLVLLAAVTALLRRWWMLVPVGVALVVAGAMTVPTFIAHTDDGGNTDLTVMSANLLGGSAEPAQLMDAVRYRGVDVLVVTEVTPEAVAGLDEAGADSYFPTRVGEARAATYTGTMVFSRLPTKAVVGTGDERVERTPSVQPEVTVTVNGRTVRIKAGHPIAPISGDTDEWRAGLSALEAWKDRQTAGGAIILAGDLNASFGHPGLRALADGLVDAQREAGQGWVRTWPFVGQRLPPFVQIDHLLSRGLPLVDAGQVAIHGTDHAAVWASYAVPAP